MVNLVFGYIFNAFNTFAIVVLLEELYSYFSIHSDNNFDITTKKPSAYNIIG